MHELGAMREGGYRYIKAVFQYSGGVVALPGFRIERARFRAVLPLAEGFKAIERHLQQLGRPMAAICACELRSPAPFDEEGFRAFNRAYVEPLREWGIMQGEEDPVARTNVCPEVSPPSEPGFYAFSYTVPAEGGEEGGFVVAGSREAPEGKGDYRDHTVRLGDRRRRECGRRPGSCWPRGSAMPPRSARAGPMPPACTSTPSTTSTPSWQRRPGRGGEGGVLALRPPARGLPRLRDGPARRLAGTRDLNGPATGRPGKEAPAAGPAPPKDLPARARQPAPARSPLGQAAELTRVKARIPVAAIGVAARSTLLPLSAEAMMKRTYKVVDAFSSRPFLDIPVAVVLDAEGLNTAAMQAIAR